MPNLRQVQIRRATTLDIPALQSFFLKAYGKETIFQSSQFLSWYFGRDVLHVAKKPEPCPLSCWIALNGQGEIVSHYGALISEITRDNYYGPIYWGVSAFTLPEYRQAGIGRETFRALFEETPVLGVIGFNPKAAMFYQDNGFNMFGKARFKRHVFLLQDDFQKVAQFIGAPKEGVEILLKYFRPPATPQAKNWRANASVVRLESRHLLDPDALQIRPSALATTRRTREYLEWRFLKNLFVPYEVFSFIQRDRTITSYVGLRREPLQPMDYYATRIIDVAGVDSEITAIIETILSLCKRRKDLYVDFGVFGSRYDKLFAAMGFACLRNDEAAALPQVSDPIAMRPNHEFIGIKEIKGSLMKIDQLTENQVLFTRADSDRDRISRLSQQPSHG